MNQSRYVIRDRETLRFWTGEFDGWTPFPGDARSFEFMTDAYLAAYAECHADPASYEAFPVQQSEAA